MAESLVFDSGVKTFELSDGNVAVEVSFNPYDMMFLGEVMDAADKLDAEQSVLSNLKTDDWKTVYQTCMDADAKMREIIDGLFRAPVCATLFPRQTVHAIGSGFPVWANLLMAVIDNMDAGLGAEKNKAQVRIRKYSEKYRR